MHIAHDIGTRLELRPVRSGDDDRFLRNLYYTVRDDLAGLFDDERQLRTLLDMQFDAQSLAYANAFPTASHDILLLDGEPVGRLMVDRRTDSICCVDLSLLPAYRNLGIGRCVFERLFDECAGAQLPLTPRVLKTNRARELYERLGFRVEADEVTHLLMKWTVPGN